MCIRDSTGTTVEFTKGSTVLRTGETREVIDVPGTYSLEPTCKAEEVAVSILDSMLDEGDVIVNVVDATHLERNLYLTLQLLERDIPVAVSYTHLLRKLGRVGGKTIIYFLATTAIAITLAIIFAIIFNPAGGYVLKEVGTYEAKAMPKVADVILNMVPTNPISAMATDNMLQIIVFALFVGISISLIGEKGKPALDFFDSVAEIMYRIVGMVMNFAPIGVFALIAWVVGTAGAEVLLPLARVIFVVYFVNILHAVVVYSGAVRIFAGMSPVQFFKGFFEATMVAFSTCSSSATLPISMRLAQENLGVPKEIASFVQPLGATINMDGTAIYQGVCAVFIANVFGITLGFPQYIMIIIAATLASIGTAGVPGAGMIMLSLVLRCV